MSMFPFHIEGYRAERISKCINAVPSEYESVFTFPKSSGDFISTGEIDHDQFTSIEDGNPVVLTYNNFTVQAGHTVTTSNRCKGLYLNILGDLTVDGTLSMTARGASAEGRYVVVTSGDTIYYCTEDPGNISSLVTIAKEGGICGIGPTCAPGVNGACGSGGGAGSSIGNGVKGGNGTSFSGGAGAGGGVSYWTGSYSAHTYNGTAGSENGGQGGSGSYMGGVSPSAGGGGAGNPGGTSNMGQTYYGKDGTGGLMILKVHGNVYITGSIQSHGSDGGDGVTEVTYSYYGSKPGSGSGGGAIHLFHKKSITGSEYITATGGSIGYTSYDSFIQYSSNGGDGTINIVKI